MLSFIFRGHEEAGFFAHAVGLCNGPSPLSVLPGNRRSTEARYACVIVIKDYFRMGVASRASGAWHYSNVEPEVLGDVRAGRAILVFDLTNEGPAYDASIFRSLYQWIEDNQLPPRRCIWLSQNRLMGRAASADAGPRAALIDFNHYDYFVKIMAWQFAQPNPTPSQKSANPINSLPPMEPNRKDKLLLCLNATPRLSRTLTVAALQHHQLLHRSLVSFPGLNYVKAGASLPDVLKFIDLNPRLEYLRPWVNNLAHMTALKVDDFEEKGNQLVEKIDRTAYERTFFSLVTESDFAEPGIARVTEKTVKAFCMGHPTILIGNANSIDLMKSFGFQDWSMVFDRSIESMPTPAVRFESVFNEVQRQVERIEANPIGWLDSCREVSNFNYRYAVDGRFLSHYVNSFDRALVARMASLLDR